MGAAAGNRLCMCSVLRIAMRYSNFDALEDGYGLNLRPLSNFAQSVYGDDPCSCFQPKTAASKGTQYALLDLSLAAKMHKAIAIIETKLQGQLAEERPEYGLDHRNVLKKIDYEKGLYRAGDRDYPLLDTNFPTVDPADPNRLTADEAELMASIESSFKHSEPLHRHIRFLYTKGNTYKCVNNNLLFHGCLPMTKDGHFDGIEIKGHYYAGKSLMDFCYRQMMTAYFGSDSDPEKKDAIDFMWYLWTGTKSPLFGKSKMATFERYFIDDKKLREEIYNPYYRLSQKEEICDMIFAEFGLDSPYSHIINGHVPVKIKDGETPVKAGGKLFVIDGGISKAYQATTGIAGYTLIFNSHHLALAEHHSFEQIENDMASYTPNIHVERVMPHRLRVRDTDEGLLYMERIQDLKDLVTAFRTGAIKEQFD